MLFIAFDGVRVQIRNAPQVGAHWEYPAIKGWESSKKHFGFKSENAITRREEHFKFDTQEVGCIVQLRCFVSALMAPNRVMPWCRCDSILHGVFLPQARLICAKMRSNIGKVMTSATSRFATGTILAPSKKKKKDTPTEVGAGR